MRRRLGLEHGEFCGDVILGELKKLGLETWLFYEITKASQLVIIS